MRTKILFLVLFFISGSVFAQNSLLDVTKSVLYFSYTQDAPKSFTYKDLFIKKVLYDTVIEAKNFSKIQWTKFKNYELDKTIFYEYERLADGEYILLDSTFRIIHSVKLIADSENPGIIFGKEGPVKSKYIDSREDAPRENFTPSAKFPLKLYMDDDCERHIIYRENLNTIERTQICNENFKYLIGDIFTELSEGLNNTTPINSNFDLDKGDEIQIIYEKDMIDISTHEVTSKSTQIISSVYLGDTVIDNNKNFIVNVGNISLSSGSIEPPQKAYISLSDSGYYIDKFFIPTKNFKPVLKIDSSTTPDNPIKFIGLSAYTYDTLSGKPFSYYISYQSNAYYSTHILTYFPLIYVSAKGIEGKVTYAKIKGIEYGTKIIPEEKTDETHIRTVAALSKNKLKVEIYATETGLIQLQVQTTDAKDIFREKFGISKTGLTEFIFDTPDLENNKVYQVQLQIQKGNNITTKMVQFTVKY